jgi:hypothetical protein
MNIGNILVLGESWIFLVIDGFRLLDFLIGSFAR